MVKEVYTSAEVQKAIQQAIMSRYHPVSACYRSPLLEEVRDILYQLELDQETWGRVLLKKRDRVAWQEITTVVERELEQLTSERQRTLKF